MNLYAESSAVLAWLLGEETAGAARAALSGADLVFVSDLTIIECDRVLHRAVALGELLEADATGARAVLNAAARAWTIVRLSEAVVERARRPFPIGPIRTLDAVHLASAVIAAESVAPMVVLSLDDRVRRNASALGYEVRPVGSGSTS